MVALDPSDKLDDETAYFLVQDVVRWLNGHATRAGRSYRHEVREYKRLFGMDDNEAKNKFEYASSSTMLDWKRCRDKQRQTAKRENKP